ncbi:MAG: ATP-binding cassette domain-containing protein [Paracoccaceae bacterium]
MGPVLDLRLDWAGHGVPARTILGVLHLHAAGGETLALVGPSGQGKTTLLRIIAGLHSRWRGNLHVQGRLAMVFQEPTLLPWRNLTENLCLATDCTVQAAEQMLARVGLAGRGGDFPAALSLGQQRRLALARAFVMRPDVLLMDEPFASLDRALAADMMTLFESLRADRAAATPALTTVLVTHDPAEAARLADRILRLEGSPAVLAAAA